ncbi:MAG: hypothetical protein XD41_1081 [Desulfonauticus sp. 38_4375]|nr:MAG: hypothetical protein XD41_1081 [Desulfonauticus sp. 38_4375]
MKSLFVYLLYFFFSVFFMSYFPIVETFSPILFYNLKRGNYTNFWVLGIIALAFLEGVSILRFSIFLPFLFVQYFLFHLISEFIDFETVVFDAIYFFMVSLSLFLLIKESQILLDIYIKNINTLLYFLFSFFMYNIFCFVIKKYELT